MKKAVCQFITSILTSQVTDIPSLIVVIGSLCGQPTLLVAMLTTGCAVNRHIVVGIPALVR